LKEGRSEHFYSVLKALDPDIINLQEMYVTQGPEVQEQMQAWFPETEWHVHKMGDLITISRYPIVRPDEGRLPIISGASPVLIEISEDQQLMIVNTHFRCCDQDELRQREIDELMGFLLDATSPGERVDLRPETPFLILGDMNLVGYAQQVDSLLTGDIVNEERYGPDFDPDWDGTPLTDVLLRHTETRHTYTWRDAETSFSPGRLDYIIYSDSMITVVKHFILDTGELSAEKLAEYGLAADDSILATDHLTLVVDIVVK
jgi:endonuclease/exonuclease/phosphatase family metal-dependent hydrolase